MPTQSPDEMKKLVLFVSVVTGSLGLLLAANATIYERTSPFSAAATAARRAGLERLATHPTECAMTMQASAATERVMRHVNAGIIGSVDVLALGQSDADHMTQLFFKDGVHFYNGFVSNSWHDLVIQYEVFEDVARAHGAPRLVLYDVRSGYILRDGEEPDSAPPETGAAPWYEEIPSLLSLAQTDLTWTWLLRQGPRHRPDDDVDDFRCVAQKKKSKQSRWLADGSRINPGELDGVLAPHGQIHVDNAVGNRHPNEGRLRVLDRVLGRLKESGATIIVYSPPLNPVVFEEKRQELAVRASGVRVQAIAEQHGIDYCDLSMQAEALGCGDADFLDEMHVSRRCDEHVIRELALHCVPRAGAMLSAMLRPSTLE